MKAEDNPFPYITLVEQASAPATPASGKAKIWRGTDNKDYVLDDAGTSTEFGGAGGGGGTWSSYTPTWTATSGTPNVGSTGSLTGSYTQTGKTVMFRVNLVLGGSGISVGTGTWAFSLPVAHVAPPSGIGQHGILLGGYYEDLASRAYSSPGGRLKASSTTAFEITYSLDNSSQVGSANVFGATSPFAWATGDYFSVYGTYQAA